MAARQEMELFEKLAANYGDVPAQLLLEPLVVELSAEEKTALLSNLELLESAGLEIDDFGGNSVFLRSVPADVEQGSELGWQALPPWGQDPMPPCGPDVRADLHCPVQCPMHLLPALRQRRVLQAHSPWEPVPGCAGLHPAGWAGPMQPLSSCALSAFPRQCPAQAGYPGGMQVPDGKAVLLPVPE